MSLEFAYSFEKFGLAVDDLACGPVYALAKNVSKTEAIPSNIVGIASAVCGILLVFAGAKIVDDLFFS